MKKIRMTKKALLISVLALVVCLAMLTGTTFAWFTDQETSGNNQIIAGNLDVKLYHTNSADTNELVTESIPLFDTVKRWEPGAVIWENLIVENAGNLALKYLLTLTVGEESVHTVNGVNYKLSDKLFVKFVTDANGDYTAFNGTREDAIALFANGGETLTEFNAEGTLLPKEETATEYPTNTIGVVIYWMPSENDNIYNMNNGKTPELSANIGVILNATQLNNEEDAFGSDYDKDLTPRKEGDILQVENGIEYISGAETPMTLYLVPEDYADDTVIVPEGVKVVGNYAFAYNTNVKTVELPGTVTSLGRGFDSSTVKKVVLNEGLEQIDSRAFRSTSALEEVVISSTVKTIADNAFQKSAIKEIVIPANVLTVGETAFGASKIEKVTFEGNTAIQGYAFRGCTELRDVYLNGDNVTFIPSTLNNRNSCWFCNGESNNPNTSNITFYVVNETVAARVKTAMGAEANNIPVYVNGVLYQG